MKITPKNQIKIYLFLIFVSMLVLNLLTPLLADDYSYALNLNNEHLKGIKDILVFQINHYYTWGGRTIAHTIAQMFLLFPKYIFSIFNSLVYSLLIYLIYIHSKNNNKDKPYIIIIIHLLIYFFLPAFGQTTIWLIGSCNYLWTTTLILLFLLEYRKNKSDSILRIISMFVFGNIVGWTNENTAVGLIIITLLQILSLNLKIKKDKKRTFNIKNYQLTGLIGVINGFLIMILAPGNYIRNNKYKDNTLFVIKIFKRFIKINSLIYKNILPFIILGIIIITITIYFKKKINKNVWIYFIGSFITIYSMVLSPYFPKRALFGAVIFIIIGEIMLLYQFDEYHKIFKFIIVDLLLIGIIFYINDYTVLLKEIYKIRKEWNMRINTINASDKNQIFKFNEINQSNKKLPLHGLEDIKKNKEDWPNFVISYYYDIEGIELK